MVRSCLFFFAFIFSPVVQAAIMDSAVTRFLGSRSTDRIAVLILYAPEAGFVPTSEAQLRKSVQKYETEVLGRTRASHRERRSLWLARSTFVELDRAELYRVAQSKKVLSITDARRRAHLTESYTSGLEKSGVPELRKSHPDFDGRGVRVGIIDTGIDSFHSDLAGKVLKFRDFIGRSDNSPYDDHGHGTHVAGTVAGGSTSGTAIGIAPGAKLLIAKAFSRYGNSDDRGLLEALQWMADPDGNPNTLDAAHVVSSSWNIDGDLNRSPEEEPFCVAVENLVNLGIVPVFSSGNDGPGGNTVKVPGACPAAVTVGATDDYDRIAEFSSRGPVHWRNMDFIKPDIVAAGVDVYSAAAGGGYTYKSGTSMSTPHVAGALAIVRQLNPSISVSKLSSKLFQAASDLGTPGLDPIFGFGRLWIPGAAQASSAR